MSYWPGSANLSRAPGFLQFYFYFLFFLLLFIFYFIYLLSNYLIVLLRLCCLFGILIIVFTRICVRILGTLRPFHVIKANVCDIFKDVSQSRHFWFLQNVLLLKVGRYWPLIFRYAF